jgi:hypothetical protein
MTTAEFIYTVLLKPPFLRKVANATLKAILPMTVEVRGATIHLDPEDPVISGALMMRLYRKTLNVRLALRHFIRSIFSFQSNHIMVNAVGTFVDDTFENHSVFVAVRSITHIVRSQDH